MLTRALQSRGAVRALLACALVSLGYAPGAGAQEAGEPYEGFFELYIERLPARPTIVALVDDYGSVLLPLDVILSLTGIPARRSGEVTTLEWPPESWSSTIDRSSRTIVLPDDTLRASAAEWVEQDGEVFLSTEFVGRLLLAEVRVDMAALTVAIVGNPGFPAVVRATTEARRQRAQMMAQAYDPNRYDDVPYPSRTGGFVAGWNVSMAQSYGVSRGSVRPTMGAGVLGGGLEVGVTGLFEEGRSAEVADATASYLRVFPNNTWLRQVQAGTIATGGVVTRNLVGASITNEPFVTPRYFDDAVVMPTVPAGWEYEVYQGQQLIGVSSADSRSELRVPINYGNTPVRFRLIGPAGQERFEDLVYLVPASRVPAGEWRYSAGGGGCRYSDCTGYAFGEVGHGITSRLTLFLGGDYLSADGTSEFNPYGRLGFSPTPDLSVALQSWGTSFVRANLEYERGSGAGIRGAYTWSDALARSGGAPGWTARGSASVPLPTLSRRLLNARFSLQGLTHSRLDIWQAAVSTNFGLTYLEAGAESGLQAGPLATGRGMRTIVRHLPAALSSLTLGVGVGVGRDGFEMMEFEGRITTIDRTIVDASIRHRKGLSPRFTLGMTIQSGLGLFRARASHDRGSGVYVGADGGVAFSPETGLVPMTFQGVGRGGIAGTVFYDANGNGRRDSDEEIVPDVTVNVGSARVRTDEVGRFRAWQVLPFEGTTVTIDSLSVDPEWAAAEVEVLVRPSPNLFADISIPLYRTRELMGTVLRVSSDLGGLGGALVEILDANTGEIVATERTFSDGIFYISRVKPGSYIARLGESTLGAIGVDSAREVSFEVPFESSDMVHVPDLIVR